MVGYELASLALDLEAFLVGGDELLAAEAAGFRRQQRRALWIVEDIVIEEICQRVAIIDSSRIAEVGTVDEVFTRPKSAMAKQLIYPDGKRNSLATGKRYCRIVFDGNSSFEPVISNMVLECKAPVNIMFADTKNMDGKAYGQMILQLPEDERAAKRALAYLETQNIHAEEVADYASV